jgi:FAD/FMN-containing dehydrogenase
MAAIQSFDGPVVARAGNGVVYGYFENSSSVSPDGRASVVEFAPEAQKRSMTLWAGGGSDFAIMEKIKHLFDPQRLLNPGRLYGRI